tara:strand:+ start:335 stop:532 length:198 start_codon:yes stop_codon:yes gene_type:complete
MKMSELNKDGLIPGQEVDFATLTRINNKHKSEAAKNVNHTKQPKVRGHKKPSLSDAQEAAGSKGA